MTLYMEKGTVVSAVQWALPDATCPPAPAHKLRVTPEGWEMQLFSGWKKIPPYGWIVTWPSGAMDVIGPAEFETKFDETVDPQHRRDFKLTLLAHRLIHELKTVYGVNGVSIDDAPVQLDKVIQRMRLAETKAAWWDALPTVCRRLGADFDALFEAVKTRTKT